MTCFKLFQKYRFIIVTLAIALGYNPLCYSQIEAYIEGVITNQQGKPIPEVTILVEKTPFSSTSNDSGFFRIKVPAYKQINLLFNRVGYQPHVQQFRLVVGEVVTIEIKMLFAQSLEAVMIVGDNDRMLGSNKLDINDFSLGPNASGNFESFIKTQPGVASANELSSQYSVRGGSFDENLVYVNDIEISRPFLIRSGQQEGLSFINPDMVSGVKFSAGGFDVHYGDKLSSVLDVTYRKPSEFRLSSNISFLGGSMATENVSKNAKLSYIAGIRYKSSQYLLGTLDNSGNYSPSFMDFQSQVNWLPVDKLEISYLGNFSQNKYEFIPETEDVSFGTQRQAYNMKVYYEGKETSTNRTVTNAISTTYKPNNDFSLKFIMSAFSSIEQESFDIDGQYLISELDNNSDSSTSNDSIIHIGAAGMLNHARNMINNNSLAINHIGNYNFEKHSIKWSIGYKKEFINEKQDEWSIIDSVGYSIPNSNNAIQLIDVANGNHNVHFTTLTSYIQDVWFFDIGTSKFILNGGIRLNYRDYSKELLFSPRLRFTFKPCWEKDILFFVATGIYNQPTIYKEMRDVHGNLNSNIKAQRSVHYVFGADYNLKLWDRPFKIISELYYKNMTNLIPYKVNNIRMEYTAKNNVKGYSEGIDLKINGEFVPGIESWAGLSIMKTEEDISDDFYIDKNGNTIEPSYFSTPTDQRVTFNLFFQDYLPNNPTLQMHMALAYGSSFQLSQPRSARFDKTYPIGPYRRVDIGFSKTLIKEKNKIFERKIKEMIISFEVFNLLDIKNKASYMWIQTFSSNENTKNTFAVPNYLTSRRLNLKLSIKL